jgi:hypothetical protein
MKICFKCNTLFERHFDIGLIKVCPVKDCYGDVVEIDDNIFHPIQTLNNKGYTTQHCCSGHLWGGSPYIVFDEMVNKNCFDTYPGGFLQSEFGTKAYISRIIKNKDVLYKQRELNKSAYELLKWAEELSAAKILRVRFSPKNNSINIDIEKMVKEEVNLFFLGEIPIDDDALQYIFKTIVTPDTATTLSKKIQDFADREQLDVNLEVNEHNSDDLFNSVFG